MIKLMYLLAGILFLFSCNSHNNIIRIFREPVYTKNKFTLKYKDTVAFVKPLLAIYEQADSKTYLPVHNKSEQLTQAILMPTYRTLLHQKLTIVNYTPDSLTRKLLVKDLEAYTDRITNYHKVKKFRLNDTLAMYLRKSIQQKYIIIPFIKWISWTEAYYNKKARRRAWSSSSHSPDAGLFGTFYSAWFLCIEVATGEIIYYRGNFDIVAGEGSSPEFYFKLGNKANFNVISLCKSFSKKVKKK